MGKEKAILEGKKFIIYKKDDVKVLVGEYKISVQRLHIMGDTSAKELKKQLDWIALWEKKLYDE